MNLQIGSLKDDEEMADSREQQKEEGHARTMVFMVFRPTNHQNKLYTYAAHF